MCSSEPVCPACGHVFDYDEYAENHTTYHGDGGAVADNCPNCEVALMVTEIVERSYEVRLAGSEGG